MQGCYFEALNNSSLHFLSVQFCPSSLSDFSSFLFYLTHIVLEQGCMFQLSLLYYANNIQHTHLHTRIVSRMPQGNH